MTDGESVCVCVRERERVYGLRNSECEDRERKG